MILRVTYNTYYLNISEILYFEFLSLDLDHNMYQKIMPTIVRSTHRYTQQSEDARIFHVCCQDEELVTNIMNITFNRYCVCVCCVCVCARPRCFTCGNKNF